MKHIRARRWGQHEEADSTYCSRTISTLSETLDILEHIYEKLMSISGHNSPIDGTEITYDAIAVVAAVPKFYLNRHLYIFIKLMNTLSRHCPKKKHRRAMPQMFRQAWIRVYNTNALQYPYINTLGAPVSNMPHREGAWVGILMREYILHVYIHNNH